jgi:rhamnosyltransferase
MPGAKGAGADVRVSVVIPTWNGGARFAEVLRALRRQTGVGEVEIVVVDSSSTDETREAARGAGARVVEIRKEDFNHGHTRNHGIRESRGQLVGLLTQDALPLGDGFLHALAARLEEDPLAAGVYGRQVPRPGAHPLLRHRLERWAAGRDEPVVQSLPAGAAFERLEARERFRLSSFDNVASMVRRAAWDALPFARRDFGEDVEWASRAVRAGWRVVFEPTAVVEHSHDRSLYDEFRRIYCDHQNLHELFDLRTVPDLAAVRRAVPWGLATYVPILERSGRRGLSARAHAAVWALSEALAQYLGARSVEAVRRGAVWRAFDRRMKRGIG